MAKFPRTNKPAPAPAPARRPAPEDEPPHPAEQPRETRQSDRKPYFKAEHVPARGTEVDVCVLAPIRLYTGGKFGHQIILGVVTENDEEFDWSIKIGGQQFMRIEQRLGKDLTAWPGQVVPVKRGDYDGKAYVEVVEK